MSYEIVRSIKIDKKNKKVFVNCASNNCWPHTFQKHESANLSHLLETKGEVGAIKEILYAYYSGEFQPGGKNYYSKALTLLDHDKYNWRNGSDELFTIDDVKDELYKHYLTMKAEPTGKFIILLPREQTYVMKFTARRAFTTRYQGAAKVYKKRSDAESRIRNYKGLVIKEI